MIDFHTHILPGIDDGSKDTQESLQMLHELYRQGVRKVIATPHFYADSMSPERFLRKRNEAWEKLLPLTDGETPEVLLGAEVMYYEGIARTRELDRLCIEGTDVLLLEMPTVKWTERIIGSVIELNNKSDIIPLLAHIERYLPYNKKALRFMRDEGIMMQMSTDCFSQKKERKSALKMIKNGDVCVLGTDCHNMDDRKPDYSQAAEVIKNSLGDRYISFIEASEERLLNG